MKTLWKKAVFDVWICGEYSSGNLYIAGPDGGNIFNTTEEGVITAINELNEQTIEYAKEQFAEYFGEVQSVRVAVMQGLTVGDDVPIWDSYEVLV